MRKSPFIWLGSGRARKRNVALKGQLLDQAARSGLPVPEGGLLLDDFFHICLAEGVIERVGSKIIVPDPIWLQEVIFRDIRFPRLAGSAAVRSAAALSANDAEDIDRAKLNITLDDAGELAAALADIWSLISGSEEKPGQDLLIMQMVNVQTAGEAAIITGDENDRIMLRIGDDAVMPLSFTLKQIGAFQRVSTGQPPYAQRLQKLLRGVRRSFGKGSWRIEWVDDGEICWIIQIS